MPSEHAANRWMMSRAKAINRSGVREPGAGLLREEVYDQLRSALIAGDYVPGEILVEGVLAEGFGVSRSPVREALHRLAEEGLLKILPRSGYLVTAVSPSDIAENVHLRVVLEGEAARLAAARIAPGEIERLREIQRLEEEPGADSVGLNRDFHMVVAANSGSRLLSKSIASLLDQDERLLRLHPLILNPTATRAHWEIIEALEAGDPGAASGAMRRHIREMAQRISPRLEGFAEGGSVEGATG
jgi:DNA-binding GntR family transcriptional regulator